MQDELASQGKELAKRITRKENILEMEKFKKKFNEIAKGPTPVDRYQESSDESEDIQKLT